jgi:SAM-dependent methyltransferase
MSTVSGTGGGAPRRRTSRPPAPRLSLGASDAAVFETFVVPRYMALFGDFVVEMLAESADAQVVHVGCRTGFPDRGVLLRLPGAHVYGCDPSPHAIELARAKAAATAGMVADYRVAEGPQTPFPSAAFSHAYTLHPSGTPEHRMRLLGEQARLLAAHGQALISMPLRGSFQEIADLFREFALKHESDEVSSAVEAAVLLRPTVESFAKEFQDAGFDYVDVAARPTKLVFQSGRDFFEDPITRLLLLPEFRLNLALSDFDEPSIYVRDAIDKYWSDGTFELSVNVGCASGRKKPK